MTEWNEKQVEYLELFVAVKERFAILNEQGVGINPYGVMDKKIDLLAEMLLGDADLDDFHLEDIRNQAQLVNEIEQAMEAQRNREELLKGVGGNRQQRRQAARQQAKEATSGIITPN